MARPRSVAEAIRMGRPFHSAGQEGVIGLLLTADAVRRAYARVIAERAGITLQQFNVLRILRGAGDAGLPTLEIAERMIERTPGVTRLIDRLARKRLVARARSTEDKRQRLCRITPAGLRLLTALDAPVRRADDAALAALRPGEVRTLIALLDRVRARHDR